MFGSGPKYFLNFQVKFQKEFITKTFVKRHFGSLSLNQKITA